MRERKYVEEDLPSCPVSDVSVQINVVAELLLDIREYMEEIKINTSIILDEVCRRR
jgi:hypothetical protein